MSGQKLHVIIDGVEIPADIGQTILEAAQAAGIYIPRLCYHPELVPGGHCRLCTVKANGKPINACTMTVTDGMVIESDTAEMNSERRHILEMLFVEGNHFCPFCEASGSCELQALAYRLGMTAPAYPYFFPRRRVDASHPDVFIDRNRCILCGRCVRASRDRDGKSVFGFAGRGIGTLIAVDSPAGLSDTQLSAADRAAQLCPTGSIVIKRLAYRVPYGKRRYDLRPIGADIEKKRTDDG
ncbi:MAG TPA: 2Fe-2S iron-sulfur cluster-binding protein [Spirochaetia bacterium]|nr:2Fe-2S iron-sulfur cluster-binding protein [Spirochaetia bacterium]